MAGKKLTKFDFVIGNPPYQQDLEGTSDKPVYDVFMDNAFKVADKVELITPARFLFNAGKTPKEWNEKMLNDEHFKVLMYEQDSKRVFPNIQGIMGGVAITYRDSSQNFGAIETYTIDKFINSAFQKIKKQTYNVPSINTIMQLQNKFNLQNVFNDFPEYKTFIDSKGNEKERTERRLTTSIFNCMPKIFTEEKTDSNKIKIYGIVNTTKRINKFISNKYLAESENLEKYKVLICKSNPSGFGEKITNPFIAKPNEGYTQSFIAIGSFESDEIPKNIIKYISTKFCRMLLDILKITQDNPPEKWKYVPLQDFTNKSDIDWSKSIKEIDQQLYKKYNLSEDEIKFIEENIKEME